MEINNVFSCPKCSNKDFTIKRESTYVYSYKFHSQYTNADSLPFLFDNRENITNKEFIQCDVCGEKYPLDLEKLKGKINVTILQKALRSDIVQDPEFWG